MTVMSGEYTATFAESSYYVVWTCFSQASIKGLFRGIKQVEGEVWNEAHLEYFVQSSTQLT